MTSLARNAKLLIVLLICDESCLEIHIQMRDLRSVGAKLKIVLIPKGDQDGVLKKLKDCKRTFIDRLRSLCGAFLYRCV